MASISPYDLVSLFDKALSEKWGYIYGATGGTWTQKQQDAATREQTVKWGQRWVGRRVADCSGLFYWAFKQLGGYMYHGSNTMFKKYSTASGQLKNGLRSDGKMLMVGSAVYKYSSDTGYHHVGLYVGSGMVIEAKGTYYGVVKSNVSEWSHWSELKGVSYHGENTEAEIPEKIVGSCKVVAKSGSTVRMRADGNKNAKTVFNVPVGASINVISDDGTWCKVQYQMEGYMMKEFLEVQSDGANNV